MCSITCVMDVVLHHIHIARNLQRFFWKLLEKSIVRCLKLELLVVGVVHGWPVLHGSRNVRQVRHVAWCTYVTSYKTVQCAAGAQFRSIVFVTSPLYLV